MNLLEEQQRVKADTLTLSLTLHAIPHHIPHELIVCAPVFYIGSERNERFCFNKLMSTAYQED